METLKFYIEIDKQAMEILLYHKNKLMLQGKKRVSYSDAIKRMEYAK